MCQETKILQCIEIGSGRFVQVMGPAQLAFEAAIQQLVLLIFYYKE